MESDNIFSTVMGKAENGLTRALGLIIHYNQSALRSLLKLCGVKNIRSTLFDKIKIYAQVKHGKFGVTDLEIILDDKFYIIIEAKLDSPPDRDQLERYSKFLSQKRDKFKDIRLILITRKDEWRFYSSCFDKGKFESLTKSEFIYIEWETLMRKLYKSLILKSKTELDGDFWNFLRRNSMPVEIIVVPEEDPGRFDVYKRNKIYPVGVEGSWPKKIPMYIAFYTFGEDFKEYKEPEIRDSVSYIAKVKKVSEKTMTGKELNQKYESDVWFYSFNEENEYVIWHTGPFIKLSKRIMKKERRITSRGYETDFNKLLRARYVNEL